jgi:hypothetical protein
MNNNNSTSTSKNIIRFFVIIFLGALVGLVAFYILRKLGY